MLGVPIPSGRARSTAKLDLSPVYGDFLSEKAQGTENSSARQGLTATHLRLLFVNPVLQIQAQTLAQCAESGVGLARERLGHVRSPVLSARTQAAARTVRPGSRQFRTPTLYSLGVRYRAGSFRICGPAWFLREPVTMGLQGRSTLVIKAEAGDFHQDSRR